MQARFRMSMAYMASVVLIQSTAATRSAPPVLKRGADDRGPVALAAPFATLTAATPARSDLLPAVRLGENLRLSGANLTGDGVTTVVFENAATGVRIERAPPAPTSATEWIIPLPDPTVDTAAMSLWQPGIYAVSLRIVRPNVPAYTTNSVPMALAPVVTVAPAAPNAGNFTVTLTSAPRLAPVQAQRASLAFGSDVYPLTSSNSPGDLTQPTTLRFDLTGIAAGDYIVRLRVDGIESLPVLLTGTPPVLSFDPAQTVAVQ